MNPKRTVSDQDQARIDAARRELDTATANFKAVVLDVATRSSVRETAAAARIAPDTLDRWKKGK